jgi:hypothetical protein
MIQETIDMLGMTAKDKVTGFEGVVSSISFDLYGCVQASLTPRAKAKAEEIKYGHWFDIARLELKKGKTSRVMHAPDFRAMATRPQNFGHGAAPKPPMERPA